MYSHTRPATLALKGILQYLEAKPDDKDLDTGLIHRACIHGLDEESFFDGRTPIQPQQNFNPGVEEDDIPEKGLVRGFEETLCGLVHPSLQPHQSCPVCKEPMSKE
jgi:hypothetical protein